MTASERWKALGRLRAVRTALFLLGCFLLVLTPFVGVLPGPGGIVVFGAGAALVLRYSAWAKRRYVWFERKFPKAAAWSDWALRRPSPRRRERRRLRCLSWTIAEGVRRKEVARVTRSDGEAQLVLVRDEVGAAYFIERRFAPGGPFEFEPYWAPVGFSGPHETLDAARREGLRALKRVD